MKTSEQQVQYRTKYILIKPLSLLPISSSLFHAQPSVNKFPAKNSRLDSLCPTTAVITYVYEQKHGTRHGIKHHPGN